MTRMALAVAGLPGGVGEEFYKTALGIQRRLLLGTYALFGQGEERAATQPSSGGEYPGWQAAVFQTWVPVPGRPCNFFCDQPVQQPAVRAKIYSTRQVAGLFPWADALMRGAAFPAI